MNTNSRLVRSRRRNRHRVIHSLTRNIQAINEGPERLERLTTNPPDERGIKMRKFVAATVAALALTLGVGVAGAPDAAATPAQDAAYVACVAQGGLYNELGPDAQAAIGRMIATDIANGVPPLVERDWVYYHTPVEIGVTQANWLVNCATMVWLGFGPQRPPDAIGGGVLR